MNRRCFLGAILAAGVAPAIGSSGILMPVRALSASMLILYGDGVADDTNALQGWIDGKPVYRQNGERLDDHLLLGGTYSLSSALVIPRDRRICISHAHLRFNPTRAAMEDAMHEAEHALIVDSSGAMRRQQKG